MWCPGVRGEDWSCNWLSRFLLRLDDTEGQRVLGQGRVGGLGAGGPIRWAWSYGAWQQRRRQWLTRAPPPGRGGARGHGEGETGQQEDPVQPAASPCCPALPHVQPPEHGECNYGTTLTWPSWVHHQAAVMGRGLGPEALPEWPHAMTSLLTCHSVAALRLSGPWYPPRGRQVRAWCPVLWERAWHLLPHVGEMLQEAMLRDLGWPKLPNCHPCWKQLRDCRSGFLDTQPNTKWQVCAWGPDPEAWPGQLSWEHPVLTFSGWASSCAGRTVLPMCRPAHAEPGPPWGSWCPQSPSSSVWRPEPVPPLTQSLAPRTCTTSHTHRWGSCSPPSLTLMTSTSSWMATTWVSSVCASSMRSLLTLMR